MKPQQLRRIWSLLLATMLLAYNASAQTATPPTTAPSPSENEETEETSAEAFSPTNTTNAPTSCATGDYTGLPELTFYAVNTREQVRGRLYRSDGTVDPAMQRRLSHLLRDTVVDRDSPVVPRTLQLLVRIAQHLHATRIDIVSAYRTGLRSNGRRQRREGYHGVGSAIDFRMPEVDSARVAAYARTLCHVGVGYYPDSNFVHLDSREQSYFWEHRGAHQRHGYDRPLDRGNVAERDRAWSSAEDSPWDSRVGINLDLHPRVIAGHHAPRHSRRSARHHRRSHRRHRPALHVFRGTH